MAEAVSESVHITANLSTGQDLHHHRNCPPTRPGGRIRVQLQILASPSAGKTASVN